MSLASAKWRERAPGDRSAEILAPTILRAPYVIYFGDVEAKGYAKTGLGLIDWRPELCRAQFRLRGCAVDGGLPEMAFDECIAAGIKSLVIGVAPAGGSISSKWLKDLVSAARAGLDIVSGMHARLGTFPELAAAAEASGAQLVDVRTPPRDLPIGTGAKRSGRRLLTVGSDCAVGKKYTALAIEKEMRARGWKADFRATGQTGIMIAGSGIAIDAVVADFLSGAAEALSPAAEPDHWDVVEGQGAISHPSFAGVSLGLLHGSQPDALVLCHDPSRNHHLGTEKTGTFFLPPLNETLALNLEHAQRVNKEAKFVGVSLNMSDIAPDERRALREAITEETGLPVVDPMITGVGAIVDRVEKEFSV